MPKYLNWEDHRHEIYQRYITEDRALAKTDIIFYELQTARDDENLLNLVCLNREDVIYITNNAGSY
jgi:hypothetical protein